MQSARSACLLYHSIAAEVCCSAETFRLVPLAAASNCSNLAGLPEGLLSAAGASVRRSSKRRWVTRQLQRLAGVGYLRPIDFQYRNIAVDEVPDIGVSTFRREGDTLGKPTDLDLVHFRYLLALDL